MGTFEVVKLKFNSPLHMGKGHVGQYDSSDHIIYSDTLKSAVFVAALDLDDSLKESENSRAFFNAFTISSAFPFSEGELFFPKPINSAITITGDRLTKEEKRKKIKKIKFISQCYFEEHLNGGTIKVDEQQIVNDIFLSKTLYQPSKKPLVFKTEVLQKVVVPRYLGDEDAEPYYIEQLFFRKGTGLFFLLKIEEEHTSYRKLILNSIALLSERGLGMDRSSGCGFFDVDTNTLEQVTIQEPTEGDYWTNLSLYCPSSTEFSLFENQHTLYELVKRGGYMTSEGAKHLALRKKSVYMVKEGAVLASNKNLQGDLKDLVPNILEGGNPVWRDGQSIFLRLKQQHNEKR